MKRIVALTVVICMLLTMLPASVLAEGMAAAGVTRSNENNYAVETGNENNRLDAASNGVFYELSEEIESGAKYVIVSNGYAVKNEEVAEPSVGSGKSLASAPVTVVDGRITSEITEDMVWKFLEGTSEWAPGYTGYWITNDSAEEAILTRGKLSARAAAPLNTSTYTVDTISTKPTWGFWYFDELEGNYPAGSKCMMLIGDVNNSGDYVFFLQASETSTVAPGFARDRLEEQCATGAVQLYKEVVASSTEPESTIIDFTNPADASKFELVNGTTAIVEGEGLTIASTTTCPEPANGQNAVVDGMADTVLVPASGDYIATLEFNFSQGSSRGWYEFFAFFAMKDTNNMAGIRANDTAMQDYIRKAGEVTKETQNSGSGLKAANTHWLRMVKTGDTIECYASTDGENFGDVLFTHDVSGMDVDTILIDAYSGMATGYTYTLKSLVIEKGTATPPVTCEHANTQVRGAVEATCTEDGYSGDTWCLDCGKKIADGEVISALGHDFDNDGICTRCGAVDPYYGKPYTISSEDYDYTFIYNEETGEYTSNNQGQHNTTAGMVLTTDTRIFLTLSYRVSSESRYDVFTVVKNDSETLFSISGEREYKSLYIVLEAGDTLHFTYSKDGSTSSGDDTAYIKDLTATDSFDDNAVIASGVCGENLKWTLNMGGTLTIFGSGDMTNYSGNAPWYSMRDRIKTVVIQPGATSIGNFAFYYCECLTDVTIPEGVTTIGNNAFSECSLTSVTIPTGVTSIGGAAFLYCSSLTSVTIPSSVTAIGESAFHGCSSLTSMTIPAGVTAIGERVFYDCSSLTSVTIPAGVTAIGEYAFCRCRSLTSMTIPAGVTAIGEGTFYGCSSLTSVTIPTGVTAIGEGTFYGCSSLTSVTIPTGVTSIGSSAFEGCTSLTDITIPGSVINIESSAFCYCSGLTSVTIPASVTRIEPYTFAYCYELTNVTIPASVTAIGEHAFYGCSSLTSVMIPKNVTAIDGYAFYECSNLADAWFLGDAPGSFGDYVFDSCASDFTIYYPARASGWTTPTWNGYPAYPCTAIGTCGENVTWVLYEDGRLVISGTGDMKDYDDNEDLAPWFSLRRSIRTAEIQPGVTSVGAFAFYDCSSLTDVTIPEGVTDIKNFAFRECYSLTGVTIPESVTNIGKSAFWCCYSLTDVTIPAGVTSIGDALFEFCCGLRSVTILADVTDIKQYMFAKCGNLTSIEIPQSVTSIGNTAFYECATLTDVVIPAGVTEIGGSAFGSCYSLASARFDGDAPVSFGSGVFVGCASDFAIYYPAGASGWTTPTWNGYPAYPYEAACEHAETEIRDAAEPTCTLDGYTGDTWCVVCGEKIADGKVMPALGHDFDNDGICTRCGEVNHGAVTASGTCGDNAAWVLYDDGTLVISGTGDMWNYAYYASDMPWYSQRKDITSVKIEQGITSIGNGIFSNCTNLHNVAIPDSITSIGEDAFFHCESLSDVSIPDSVTCIGNHALYGCSSLTSVIIPSSVTKIADGVFANCSGLTNVVIPNSITEIGEGAFAYCSSLPSVTIPDSVTSVGRSAFSYCRGLICVTIPGSVTDIGDYAFAECSGLNDITISEGVTSIGDCAFYLCTGLNSVTIPDSVVSIGGNAFWDCSSLTSVVIGDGVTSIGVFAFYDCVSLTSVIFGKSVTCIGVSAFRRCNSLTSITIPNTVTTIEDCAFHECGSLTSVTIGCNVTKVGPYAFHSCSNLVSAHFLGNTPESFGDYVFDACAADFAIYYPANASGWTTPTWNGYPAYPYGATCEHAETEICDAVDPTCTEDGYTGDTWCVVCGEKIADGEVIPALGHDYQNGVCIRCGAVNPNYHPTRITVGSVLGVPGSKISIPVLISNNQEGFAGFRFVVNYDSAALHLDSVEAQVGDLTTAGTLIPNVAQNIIVWYDIYDCTAESGTLLHLNFSVSENVDGDDTAVSISIDDEQDFANIEKPVAVEFISGTVSFGLLGDVDCNGSVNIRDVIALARAVANMSTLSDAGRKAADVDKNGTVNIRDVIKLARCVANMDTLNRMPTTKYLAVPRGLKNAVVEEQQLEITIGSELAADGKVTVPVSFRGNPGIAGFDFDIQYDHSKLKLAAVSLADGIPGTIIPNIVGDKVIWYHTGDVSTDGAWLYLTFDVLDEEMGEGQITVSTADRDCIASVEDAVCAVIKAGKAISERTVRFRDVAADQYYIRSVTWAVSKGIACGITDDTFAPGKVTTRAQVVTFLWRACGSPEPESAATPFVDVPAGKYYTKAVQWAVEQGITNGADATHFRPDETVSRGQLVTFLYRAAGNPAAEGIHAFADVKAGAYYGDAVTWASENGIAFGKSETVFAPNVSCTRGQAVTFLHRVYR